MVQNDVQSITDNARRLNNVFNIMTRRVASEIQTVDPPVLKPVHYLIN
jgi:hypothetical protein